MRRMSEEHGVTVVELMVVIAVLGVLAALVGPSVFGSIERQQASGMARDFANELRRARNQAMSRGEIVVVQVTDNNGGTLSTNAVNLPLPDGTFLDGDNPPACDPETEDEGPPTGTDNCPEGAVCLRDGCYGRPARSCRQFVNAGMREVTSFTMQTKGDAVELRHFAELPETTLCFSPDGRVLDTQGTVIGGDPHACDGENLVFVIGESDSPDGTADCSDRDDETARNLREQYHVYRVSVPYNGAIQMRQ